MQDTFELELGQACATIWYLVLYTSIRLEGSERSDPTGNPGGGIRAVGYVRRDPSGGIRAEGSERRDPSGGIRAEGSERRDLSGGV